MPLPPVLGRHWLAGAVLALATSCSLMWDAAEHRGGPGDGTGNLGGQYLDGASGSAGTGAGGSGSVDSGPDSGCAPGTADCLSSVAGCETHITTDPVHCGQCTHDCMGGSCAEGMCQPQLIGAFEGPAEPNVHFGTQCRLFESTLYALKFASSSNGGGLYVVPDASNISFGTPTRSHALDSAINVIALTNGQVVATAGGAYTLGTTTELLLPDGSWGMTHVGGQLRITSMGTLHAFTDSEIESLLAGGSVPQSNSQALKALDITDTGTDVCWTNPGDKQVGCLTAWSGTPVDLPDSPYAVESDEQNLYWTDDQQSPPSNTRGVKKASLTGKPKYETLISGYSFGRGLALDDANVYAALGTPSDGVIARVAKTGGTPTILASGLNYPFGVTVDQTFAYFTTADGIYRVRLP